MSLYPQYARPRKLEQATALLGALGTGTMVIAGGQELMPSMNYGKLALEVIVDITGLAELRDISQDDGRLSIGALTTHREIQDSEAVHQLAPLLAFSVQQVGGGWQVHNRGTIGGNIVSMHPLYDIVPSLLALDAEVEVCDESGVRTTKLADLIQDTKHGLGVTSILSRVLIDPMPSGCGWAYEKLKTTHGAYGSANAAAIAQVAADGRLESVSMVLGAAADRPVVMTGALGDLVGRLADEVMAAELEARCAAAVAQPLSDHQGPAEYRRAMAGVMARRAFLRAVERAADARS